MVDLHHILDLARWAPSGDNTQPWRFEIAAPNRVTVHAFDTRTHCVYDLDGHASQISVGALLETMRVAATAQRLRTSYARRPSSPEDRPIFDVEFAPDENVEPSELLPYIQQRTVQRRALRRDVLTDAQKSKLMKGVPNGYDLLWLEGGRRAAIARLLFRSAHIRLTTREAFEVHRATIRWNATHSHDGIPDRAIGLDPATTRLMQWAMQDWGRVRFLNRFMAGTVLPRVQLDLVPALACGAHALILGPDCPAGIDDYVSAGVAVQRFWLTVACVGLLHQPEITPLIFARYAREGMPFTKDRRAQNRATAIARDLERIIGAEAHRRAVWLGRIGSGAVPTARSTRLPLEELLVH